jgi:hypothetical protein
MNEIYITEYTQNLVLRMAQDALYRGTGNKIWSDSADAGDDKTAPENL